MVDLLQGVAWLGNHDIIRCHGCFQFGDEAKLVRAAALGHDGTASGDVIDKLRFEPHAKDNILICVKC